MLTLHLVLTVTVYLADTTNNITSNIPCTLRAKQINRCDVL